MERSLIDLGTQPLGHTLPSAELDADRLDFLVDSLNIVELPVVLDVFPRFATFEESRDARTRGHDRLVEDGLIRDGRIHQDVEAWLRILEQPRWYVSARLVPRPFTDDVPVVRVCVAEGDAGTVIAVRNGGPLTVRPVRSDAATELLGALGPGRAMEFRGLSAPTDLLSEALDATPADASGTAARLTRIGIDTDVAFDVASAMSTCSGHAEITTVAIRSGNRTTGAHPVAFFDTHRGRIAATSSTAADGRRWSTFSAGTDIRMKSALRELTADASS